jgi:hypothetical protein
MRCIYILVTASALCVPSICVAKRLPPQKVEPVVVADIRIEAPLDSGRLGRIQAFDCSDGHLMWVLTVFENKIDPKMEEDVQWRFIKKLTFANGSLEVLAEDNTRYSVDLSTHKVTELTNGN